MKLKCVAQFIIVRDAGSSRKSFGSTKSCTYPQTVHTKGLACDPRMRDVLGRIYTDEQFADLFPKEGQLAQAPWRLALVTVLQFVEDLSDQQAADAVRGRIEMRAALNSLAVVAPDWLRAHSHPEWVERYGPRSEDSRSPLGEQAREAFVEEIGQQGRELLDALFDPTAPEWLRHVPAGEILRQVWVQTYQRIDDVVRWRSSENIPPPSRCIGSPYDEEAHYSKKRSTTWVGYKVHLTETCEAHLPLIVTHVETTSAPVSDDAMTATIHAELDRKELLPAEHIVDTGSVDAKLLVESQRDYQTNLVGPTRKDYHWQATQQTGFDASHFPIDWEQQQATCPEGHTSISWTPAIDNRTNEVIKIKFSMKDCQGCPSRSRCTQSIRHTRRTVTIRPRAQYEALKQRRDQEKTKEFTQLSARRAGIEGTISQGVRVMGLRRSRSIGQEKTHLQHIATAAALNMVRSLAWFSGLPRAQTHRSAFVRLYDAD